MKNEFELAKVFRFRTPDGGEEKAMVALRGRPGALRLLVERENPGAPFTPPALRHWLVAEERFRGRPVPEPWLTTVAWDLSAQPPAKEALDGGFLSMDYGNGRTELLHRGFHRGREIAVVSVRGECPCAYVDATGTRYDESGLFNSLGEKARARFDLRRRPKYDAARRDLPVHGGVTYSAGSVFGVRGLTAEGKAERWYLGWDYGHYDLDDGVVGLAGRVMNRGKKWTTEEVAAEARAAVDWLLDEAKPPRRRRIMEA